MRSHFNPIDKDFIFQVKFLCCKKFISELLSDQLYAEHFFRRSNPAAQTPQ
jgi:hypothetical protein